MTPSSQEIDIIGLSMHCTVFRQGAGTDCDEALGQCTVELERQWLFCREGHSGFADLRCEYR